MPNGEMKTVFAYITPEMEVRSAFSEVLKYDLICPYCLFDNNIRAILGLLTRKHDFVRGIICDVCKKDYQPERMKDASRNNIV